MESDHFNSVLQQVMEQTSNSLVKYDKLLQSAKDKDMQTIIKNMFEKKQAQLALLNQINATAQEGHDISDLLSAGSFGDLSGRSEFNNNLNQLIQAGMNDSQTNTATAKKQKRKNSTKTNECRNCKHYQYCKAMNKLMD